MRLWSISPSYLDRQGLLAVWREALLCQSVLIKGEYLKCNNCNKGIIERDLIYGYDDIKNCSLCKGTGKIKTPYYNHPQVQRFKECKRPLDAIGRYLLEIYVEAEVRGYNFDSNKIKGKLSLIKLIITKGQLAFEFKHLQKKLWDRGRKKYFENENNIKIYCINETRSRIIPNPLFKVIDGEIESWEKIKKEK
jgi:hypothetical protein